jgi:hypothetical protein
MPALYWQFDTSIVYDGVNWPKYVATADSTLWGTVGRLRSSTLSGNVGSLRNGSNFNETNYVPFASSGYPGVTVTGGASYGPFYGPTTATIPQRYALSLTGGGGNVASLGSVALGTNYTWEMWINPTGYDFEYLGGFNPDTLGIGKTGIYNTDGKLFILNTGSQVGSQGTTTLATNAWSMITFVRSGNNYNVYLNGAPEIATTGATTFPASSAFIAGARSTDLQWGFKGRMANVSVYNTALTATQVSNHWNAAQGLLQAVPSPVVKYEQAVSNDTPVIYWPLNLYVFMPNPFTVADWPTYLTTDDRSGNGNVGKLCYGSSFEEINYGPYSNHDIISPSIFGSWAQRLYSGLTNATFGTCYALSLLGAVGGTSCNIISSNSVTLGSAYSWEMWINPPARTFGYLGGFSPDNLGIGKAGVYGPDGKLFVYNGGQVGSAGPTTLPTNAWSMITFVRSGNNYTVYLNGAPELAATGATPFPTSSAFIAGARTPDSTSGFNGRMAHVSVYNTALTATQVSNHWLAAQGLLVRQPSGTMFTFR